MIAKRWWIDACRVLLLASGLGMVSASTAWAHDSVSVEAGQNSLCVGDTTSVSVQTSTGSSPAANINVSLSTSVGTLGQTSGTTDSTGNFTTSLSVSNPGAGNITAQAIGSGGFSAFDVSSTIVVEPFQWSPEPPIDAVLVGPTIVQPGQQGTFQLPDPKDFDTRGCGQTQELQRDALQATAWSATAGQILSQSNELMVWKAPTNPGPGPLIVTISATVDDLPNPVPPGEAGDRNDDPPKTFTMTVEVPPCFWDPAPSITGALTGPTQVVELSQVTFNLQREDLDTKTCPNPQQVSDTLRNTAWTASAGIPISQTDSQFTWQAPRVLTPDPITATITATVDDVPDSRGPNEEGSRDDPPQTFTTTVTVVPSGGGGGRRTCIILFGDEELLYSFCTGDPQAIERDEVVRYGQTATYRMVILSSALGGGDASSSYAWYWTKTEFALDGKKYKTDLGTGNPKPVTWTIPEAKKPLPANRCGPGVEAEGELFVKNAFLPGGPSFPKVAINKPVRIQKGGLVRTTTVGNLIQREYDTGFVELCQAQ